VDAVGDRQGLLPHAAGLAHALDLGVEPQVRVAPLERLFAEDPHLLVQAPARPAGLVFVHAVQAELLDEPVDLSGRDAVDVGLLDDRDERLLGAPARLEDRRTA